MVMIWVLALFACDEKVIEKPEDLISKDQMVDILYELAIISAAKKTNPTYLVDREFDAMSYIYDKYGIDSVQFVKSDVYYASIPAEYEAIYQRIEVRLEEEKSVYDLEKTRVSDSIRQAGERQREKILKESTGKSEQDSLP